MKTKTQNMLPDIERTIIMDAAIEKVWKAVTTSEALASWLMPNNFQLEMGYEFTFQSVPKNGWDGIVHCKVMEITPPTRLGFTWCGNNMEQYVSFELVKLTETRTEFTLVHSGWSEENKMLRDIMYDGWGYLTEDLGKKVSGTNGGYLS